MNIGTFVVLVVLLIIVGLAIRSMVLDKKAGRSCTGCADRNCCHNSCPSADKMVDDIMKKTKEKN